MSIFFSGEDGLLELVGPIDDCGLSCLHSVTLVIIKFGSVLDVGDGFTLSPFAGLSPGFLPKHEKKLIVRLVFVSTETVMVFPPSGTAWKFCSLLKLAVTALC